MKEGEVQKPIKDYLRKMGFKVLRVQCGKIRVKGGFMQLAEKGTSDVIALPPKQYDMKYLAVETKTEEGKLKPEQKDFLAWVNANDGLGICAKKMSDVLNALDNWMETRKNAIIN